MVLTTPILSRVETFDPVNSHDFTFSYTGEQISKKRLVIKNVATSAVVYDNMQLGMKLTYILEKNVLLPGTYTAQLQVYDFNGNASELSEPVLFYCDTIATLVLENLPSTINTSSITLSVKYTQKENIKLSEFIFYLYDHEKSLIAKSNNKYDIKDNSYIFYGLKNLSDYYVRCIGTTSHGMIADTGYCRIMVNYIVQPNNMLVSLTNHRVEGYISVDCNILDIGYEVGGNKDYVVQGGELVLRNGTNLSYNAGFSIPDEFSIFVKARKVPLNNPFVIFSSSKDVIFLTIKYLGGDYYCELDSASVLGRYKSYALLPKVHIIDQGGNLLIDEQGNAIEQVTLDYEDNYTAVFELKYKNHLHSLKVYYEDNGTIVAD